MLECNLGLFIVFLLENASKGMHISSYKTRIRGVVQGLQVTRPCRLRHLWARLNLIIYISSLMTYSVFNI